MNPSEQPCPECGHDDGDHRRESWYDEEGIEGMTCSVCEDEDKRCQWWTWDWADVVNDTAMHQGDGLDPTRKDRRMRNLFLGLDADEWATADGLPVSPYGTGEPLTVEDVKAGIVAMLRRLDADADA